jgi:hypothetical protein
MAFLVGDDDRARPLMAGEELAVVPIGIVRIRPKRARREPTSR